MKRSHMLKQQEGQYNINDFPTKSKLQIQRNPHQNSSTILYKSQEENFHLHVETKKSLGQLKQPQVIKELWEASVTLISSCTTKE